MSVRVSASLSRNKENSALKTAAIVARLHESARRSAGGEGRVSVERLVKELREEKERERSAEDEIPPFFTRPPRLSPLSREATRRALEDARSQLVTASEMAVLQSSLTKAASPPPSHTATTQVGRPSAGSLPPIAGLAAPVPEAPEQAQAQAQPRMSYEKWKRFAEEGTPAKARKYFGASVFLALSSRGEGSVSCSDAMEFVRRSEGAMDLQLRMLEFISSTAGAEVRLESMSEAEFAGFLRARVLSGKGSSLNQKLAQTEADRYVAYATRRMFFRVCGNSSGNRDRRMQLPELAGSEEGQRLLEVIDGTDSLMGGNPYSLSEFANVWGAFSALDSTKVGALSLADLSRYQGGTLTRPFLSQLLQEVPTVKTGRLGWPQFVELMVALESRNDPHSLAYFFRVLDVKKLGYLTIHNINLFYKAVHVALTLRKVNFVPSVVDIKDELFDMTRSRDPCHITLADLVACGSGGTFVTMLIDVDGFCMCNAKEQPIAPSPPSGPAPAPPVK